MSSLPNDTWNDDWIEQLVQFDEALRMGRPPAAKAPVDSQLQDTQQFLLLLQSVWPRAPKKIGPYKLVNSLGQGTVGPCYLVEDPATRQACILKILWPDLSAHAPTRQQFVRDVKAAMRLHHASIAAVHEVRDSGSLCIVVSEYAPGPSLSDWRRKRPQPLPWEIASVLIVRLAEVLEFAHREGIIHGNLKPSNIFLTSAEEITPDTLPKATLRVADFALARAVQQTRLPSQAGLAWSMPQYLAPEQLQHRSQPAEPASDLYALGVIWYDLLTGRCPVPGTTKAEIYARTFDPVPTPRHYCPELPSSVELLVLQCLQKLPRDRPLSAQHLADALRKLLLKPGEQKSPVWWKRWLGWS